MSISVNGHSSVPPGFRFHPTEEELLNYYLTKKVASEKIDMDVIRDVDLNKLEPWDIQGAITKLFISSLCIIPIRTLPQHSRFHAETCKIGSTPQNDWYFFSHKDKKYPTGTRTNRATAAGFWKATGRDKVIYTSFKRIGMRKTLVFYKGRAPHGQKSDWIMHEYRLDDQPDANSHSYVSSSIGETAAQEDGWVICRVFKKKSQQKALDSPKNCSSITSEAKTQMMHSSSDGALDQILQYMGRSCKQETEAISNMNISNNGNNDITMRYLHERFMKLPALESPPLPSLPIDLPPPHDHTIDTLYTCEQGVNDWATLDRLVASHLNGDNLGFTGPHDYHHGGGGGGGGGAEGDLWTFTRSASAPSFSDHIMHATYESP